MPSYQITGRDLRSGRRIDAKLDAPDEAQARRIAGRKGIEVEVIKPHPATPVASAQRDAIPLEPAKPIPYASADPAESRGPHLGWLALVAIVTLALGGGAAYWATTIKGGGAAGGTAAAVPSAPDPFDGWEDEQVKSGEEVLGHLEQLVSMITVGTDIDSYRMTVQEAATSMQKLERRLSAEGQGSAAYGSLSGATEAHVEAARAWMDKIDAVSRSAPEVRDLYEEILQESWKLAQLETQRARKFFYDRQ